MKQVIHLPLFSLLFIFSVQAQKTAYEQFAHTWIGTYIVHADGTLRIGTADLQEIKELVTVSFERSKATLKAQEAALAATACTWNLYHNISRTRLNPSHERPYQLCKKDREQTMRTFWQAYDYHEDICQSYADITAHVVHGDALKSPLSMDAVNELRSQARTFMLEALCDIRAHLGELYNIAFNKAGDALSALDDKVVSTEATTRLGLSDIRDFIISYVPSLAIHTFVDADALHNSISQEGWDLLHKTQEVGNQVWSAIETARCAFYQAIFDTLDELANG